MSGDEIDRPGYHAATSPRPGDSAPSYQQGKHDMSTMRRWGRLSRFALLVAIPFGMVSCSSEKIPTVPASGTVIYKGQPLEKGQIQLLPVDVNGTAAVGSIDGGKFVLSTNADGDGAPPGKYRVTVSSYQHVQSKFGGATTKSVIPNRYANPDTSGLTVEIPAGGNNAIEITLTN